MSLMKKSIFLILLLLGLQSFAQQTTYEVFTIIAPDGWTKGEEEKVHINYTHVNQQTRSWCRFVVYKSTEGSGNLLTDFNKEWNDLAVTAYKLTEPPVLTDSSMQNGWSVLTGSAQFMFDNRQSTVSMKTFVANRRCASILIVTNDPSAYEQEINTFIASVALKENTITPVSQPVEELKTVPPAAISTSYQFNTSNFDDGWTSVVKEDWVEVYKGDIRVLLHYPREEEKKYISQQDEKTRFFWNLLVAPRYSQLRNYEMLNYSMSYEPPHFAGGLLRDNQTGQDVWVTLFEKARTGWIEIITKDKQSFVNAFGINNPDSYFSEWDPLMKLAAYNKFAVGEKDLPGKWSNDFSGATNYYSVYTGIYTGSSNYASRVTFTFDKSKKYKWYLVMASGGTGIQTKVEQVNANGSYKHLGNWQLWFSDIEKKSKTYNAYFSCIKGGRILWLQDTGYGSYSSFGKIE
jgi:hypothetical protein